MPGPGPLVVDGMVQRVGPSCLVQLRGEVGEHLSNQNPGQREVGSKRKSAQVMCTQRRESFLLVGEASGPLRGPFEPLS